MGIVSAGASWRIALVATLLAMPVAPSRAADRTVRAFAAGSGAANLGVSFGDTTEDQEEEGPQAIATGQKGDLFVLDQVNGRILTFDPKTEAPPHALDLPPDVRPTDLLVNGNDIYVWDGRVHALQTLGHADAPTRGLTETRSAAPVDDSTASAFAQLGSRDIEAEATPTRGIRRNQRNDLAHQVIDTHGAGRATADVSLIDKGAGATIKVTRDGQGGGSATIRMRVRDRLGTVAFLDIDQTGRIYVLAENIPLRIEDAAFAFVARFSPGGVFEGVYEVPLSSTTISRRCVTVSPSGDVYFLRTLKTSVDVVGLGYRPMPDAKIIELAPRGNTALVAWANSKNIAVAVGPLTRQKVIQTALAYEGLTWTVAPPNYGRDDEMCNGFAGRSRVPLYMLGREGETVKGVPYCWGCQGSIQQFATRLQKGTVAGNVCTRNNPRVDVAGVDCSSFVSAAWGLSTHFSTSAIPTIASPLSNPWDLQPGDALDKPGSHVVLFMGFTPNREAMVMEASPNACKGRVCRNVYPLSWLLSRGFVPVRYRGLADAGPVAKRATEQD